MGIQRGKEGEKEGTVLMEEDTLGWSRGEEVVSCGRTWLARERVGGARIVLASMVIMGRCCNTTSVAAFVEPGAGALGRESLWPALGRAAEEGKRDSGLRIMIRDDTGGGVRSPMSERRRMIT